MMTFTLIFAAMVFVFLFLVCLHDLIETDEKSEVLFNAASCIGFPFFAIQLIKIASMINTPGAP